MIGGRSLIATLLLAGALMISAQPASAQNEETLRNFDEGNAHFAAGEYQKAISLYELAVASGYASAELYYNTGNAYYRLDELGKAMLFYKRAELLAPDNRELAHSIQLTSSKLQDKFSRLPDPFWKSTSSRIASRGLSTPIAILGLLLYLAGMALIGYRIWARKRLGSAQNEWVRRIYSVLLVIGIPLILLGMASSFTTSLDRAAVVIADEVLLREEPGEESASELSIHEGLVVRLSQNVDETTGWVEIVLPNGITGWIPAETIEAI